MKSIRQLAAFDAVRYVAKVLSVHRDIRLLLRFARKKSGRAILCKKLEVISINGEFTAFSHIHLTKTSVISTQYERDHLL